MQIEVTPRELLAIASALQTHYLAMYRNQCHVMTCAPKDDADKWRADMAALLSLCDRMASHALSA